MLPYVLDKLTSLLEPLSDRAKDKREIRDTALRAVSHALNETYLLRKQYRELLTFHKKRRAWGRCNIG